MINKREEFGHWEGDLMMFKQGIKGNLITLRERQTRFIVAIKNLDKTASGTALTLISTAGCKRKTTKFPMELNLYKIDFICSSILYFGKNLLIDSNIFY